MKLENLEEAKKIASQIAQVEEFLKGIKTPNLVIELYPSPKPDDCVGIFISNPTTRVPEDEDKNLICQNFLDAMEARYIKTLEQLHKQLELL